MSNLGEQAMEILDELHTERLAYESEYVPLADAANLLTAYEETGLAPEDILSATDMAKVACALHELNKYKELGDLDRLRELVEADRDERCVVLPCKVGDTIYDISLAEIKESNVISISFIASKSTYHVSVCAENYRHAITLDIEIGDFGKTVFLTREEAEAALEEMKNG